MCQCFHGQNKTMTVVQMGPASLTNITKEAYYFVRKVAMKNI